jgi:hypothetical protein
MSSAYPATTRIDSPPYRNIVEAPTVGHREERDSVYLPKVPKSAGCLLNHIPSCETRRMGKHKLAQVSGFRDQETEIGNSKIHS